MLWMITKDLINTEGPHNVGLCNDDLAGSIDTVRVPVEQRASVIADCDYEFRLLDDDGHVYYEGVCKDVENQSDIDAFDPLDRFMNSDGVTMMEYRKKGDTEWNML